MGMKGHDKDYTTILNLPKENVITIMGIMTPKMSGIRV